MDENMREAYEFWFAIMKGLSPLKKINIRRNIMNMEDFYHNSFAYMSLSEVEKEAFLKEKKAIEPKRAYQKFLEEGFSFVHYMHSNYPERLKNISCPPYALFIKGELPREDRLSVGIVGARKCSSYGFRAAMDFAKELALHGVEIISGLAEGVDGAAARGALKGGGKSYAALGSGADICYPSCNRGLYEELHQQGGIISEYPNGTKPLGRHFPIRNRIISGLSDVLLVMEAKEKSGSLITADMALEQGKDVYAMPGPIDSELSRGCHKLIRQGAGILLSPEDLLEELRIANRSKYLRQAVENSGVEDTQGRIYSELTAFPQTIDELSRKSQLPISRLIVELMTLELKGLAKEVGKHHYIRLV